MGVKAARSRSWIAIAKMSAYYNELDPFAAAWLRELIKAGLIADGEVDERSIELVRPDELRGFTQCHFFAGIGGWSYALRLAGWADERTVWTGSCPCQPFSAAGAQAGGDDARDLWPTWFWLISECRPHVVFGEQVEAAVGHGWLDRLCDDLEREGYAVGPCGLPGPCVGAFDIRGRLWFVADAGGERRQQNTGGASGDEGPNGRQQDGDHVIASDGAIGRMGHAEYFGLHGRRQFQRSDETRDWGGEAVRGVGGQQATERCATGFWANAEWIACLDGKARAIEPGTWPLAYGVSARMGRLRGYGNAIKPQVAQVFIEAYMSITGESERL